jgi:hypothetical protein
MTSTGPDPTIRPALGSRPRLTSDPDYPGLMLLELLDQLRDGERSAAVRRWRRMRLDPRGGAADLAVLPRSAPARQLIMIENRLRLGSGACAGRARSHAAPASGREEDLACAPD